MPERDKPPFRADHVGSLLRPASLVAARTEFQLGRITAADLRGAEDDAIRAAVRMQERVGLAAVTDGELRRRSWLTDFIRQIGGVENIGPPTSVRFEGPQGTLHTTPEATSITSKLYLARPIFTDDFRFLTSLTRSTAKQTIPSPNMVNTRRARVLVDDRVYSDAAEFERDLSGVFAAEIVAMGEAGCTYLQLDDASLATLGDPVRRAHLASLGADPERMHLDAIAIVNAALRSRPAGMTVTTHLCRGNYRSGWYASGGYDAIAEALFGELNVDGFFLEYDDERSGSFEPLRFVPRGKLVVLGLITTKTGQIESKDDIKRRIDAAAKVLPLEQLCLSPQCGFASTIEGNLITEAEQEAKLRLVVEVAREVWG